MPTLQNIIDLLAKNPPEDLPKQYLIVPDNMVDSLQEAYGSSVEVIPVSETMIAPQFPPDSFSNDSWAAGQRRIDYEKCKRIEESGIPTVWPKGFTL